jgi:hypothetical protein
MSFPINGNPSDANRWCKAADDGAQMGYQKAVQSIASGQGDLHRPDGENYLGEEN